MQLNAQCTTLLPKHCNALQYTATHCNTQDHAVECPVYDFAFNTATHSNTLPHPATPRVVQSSAQCTTVLAHAATHCNILQYTATHCNTQGHAVECLLHELYDLASHAATHCNILQHIATHRVEGTTWLLTHCSTLQYTEMLCKKQGHAVECLVYDFASKTLQRTATRCNTLQHTRSCN